MQRRLSLSKARLRQALSFSFAPSAVKPCAWLGFVRNFESLSHAAAGLGLAKAPGPVYVPLTPLRRREWREVFEVTRSMKCSRPRLLLLAGSSVLMMACESRVTPTRPWRADDHGQPAGADPLRTPTANTPEQGGTERAVEALWNISCAGCHGRDGRGHGTELPPGAEPPDFTSADFQKRYTDQDLTNAITLGKKPMPAFGKKVNPQGIALLVARVRRFATAYAPAP